MRVLVIHDARAMRTIVRRALHHLEGVDDVLQAESAEEAIEVLQNELVDLVISDWNLDGMTGIELLEALRSIEWDIRFGFVTAEHDAHIRQRAVDSGAAFFLTKPFSDRELAEALVGCGALAPLPDSYFEDAVATPATAAVDKAETDGPEDGEIRAGELETLLTKLCAIPVHVTPRRSGPDRHSPRYVASYYNEADELSGICVFATSFGLAASASITRWSPRSTLEWVGTGIIPPELVGDLREVANILSRFVRRDGLRVVLGELEGYAPGEGLPANAHLDHHDAAEHFAVEVEGYCGGLVSVVAL